MPGPNRHRVDRYPRLRRAVIANSQDPDSEILTAVNLLPANGDEAADARTLLEAEQAAHANQVEALSIDSVGFQGPLLRELSQPDGLNLTVYVPPHSQGVADNP